MRAIFLGIDLMGIADGSGAKPPNSGDAAVKADWRKHDNQTIRLLCQTIDKSMLKNVRICITSKQIWDKLKFIHEQSTFRIRLEGNGHSHKCSMAFEETIADFWEKLKSSFLS